MKTKNKVMGILLSLFLTAMPFTALRVLAVDDTTPPSSPTNLAVVLNSSNQVVLNWTASTDNTGVTGYTIMRGISTTTSPISNATSTSFIDMNTMASTTYMYSVLAFDAAGNISSSSPQVSITTPVASSTDTTIPSTPSNLIGTVASSTQINLSWNASTDNVGVTGYNIYRNNAWVASTASTTYNHSGLTPSTTYTFFVRAYDARANLSNQSNVITLTTSSTTTPPVVTPPTGEDNIAPSNPTNLTIVSTSTNQINLSWTASTDNVGVAGYSIYRNGEWLKISTTNSFTDTGLNPSTGYVYYVRAYDESGNVSGQSNIVSTSLSAPIFENDVIAPSIPTNLAVVDKTNNMVKLSWTPSTDNVEVTGYNVYKNGEWLSHTDYNSFTVTNLNASTSYTFYVRAYDVRGNMSAQSNVITVITNGNYNNDNDDDDDYDNDNWKNKHEDNVFQHKNNGNNGNHYGQLKNQDRWNQDNDDNDNWKNNKKNGKNKNR